MTIAVLNGDVINSRKVATDIWLPELKHTLNRYGQEPVDWEVFRGDSFQLKLAPEKALDAALDLKLCMLQFDGLNARIAIGIGEETYHSSRISESNGEAFVVAGELFDRMKKRTLALQVNDALYNDLMNGLLDFASFLIDGWSVSIVRVIRATLDHPDKRQTEIAKLLNMSQGNVSETYTRAGFDKVHNMLQLYKNSINTL